MSGRNVPVVLLPRYTTYIGGGSYPTLPIPSSAYGGLSATFWMGNGVGPPGVTLAWMESNDLETWTVCAGGLTSPTPNAVLPSIVTLTKAWFRLVVILANPNDGATMWCEGFFQLREQ
jgi:hypothetical protein